MHRVGYLFEEVLSYRNMDLAFDLAWKGTSHHHTAYEVYFRKEQLLFKLKKEIESHTYQPSGYSFFKIFDPKERIIAVAPFRDRVVHHALINVIEPVYEKVFIYDSYATRKRKGTHAAIRRAQQFMRRSQWFLKMDIRKYFASINHDILMDLVGRKIKDNKIVNLIEKIVRHPEYPGTGLPIGNLTSQFLANVYLNDFDHLMTENNSGVCYIRYMDDFVFFSKTRKQLSELKEEVSEYLYERYKLTIKTEGTLLKKNINGLPFLGTLIYPSVIRIRSKNLKRSLSKIERKEDKYEKGLIYEDDLLHSVESILAHIRSWNTYKKRVSVYG